MSVELYQYLLDSVASVGVDFPCKHPRCTVCEIGCGKSLHVHLLTCALGCNNKTCLVLGGLMHGRYAWAL